MVAKSVILVALLFIVVQGKSLEEVEENRSVSNDLQNIENEDVNLEVGNDENERKYVDKLNKNATFLAAVQSENMVYNKLKDEIDTYHSNLDAKNFLIYPGTKWCGTGNIAWNYNDLGLLRNADRCCRDHDYCPDSIRPSVSKYGLTNTGSTVRLLCSCDTQFYNCLKAVGSIPARDIGRIYFNSIGSQCFKEDFPIVRCTTFYTSSYRCRDYQLDTTLAKKYQFFDVPIF